MNRIAAFPNQPQQPIEPEDLLDTACERTSTVAKGALLLVAATFTFCSGFSFFYTASTEPTVNALAVRAFFFTSGIVISCIVHSYLPPCDSPNSAADA